MHLIRVSVAQARDNHYHNPPDYLVLEPEDTARRTRNLQQTNTNGYKWQGTDKQFQEATRLVENWGEGATVYRATREYQENLRQLIARYPYRLDTNFAKMDRILHPEIEDFKSRVLAHHVNGMTVAAWSRLLFRGQDLEIEDALRTHLNIEDQNAEDLVN